ncbi:MAG TPA: M20 family metallopeptidase [Burkholderiales bacterium]|nr:M20 family metallopeptidase [Burkholderiales bacterium]
MSHADAIALTRELVSFDTVNPPGRERECARRVGALLQEWGFAVDYYEYEDARTSVIARLGAADEKLPLCLTGHIDVVPLGTSPWSRDPFAGETDGDRLYGRGTSDMKAGVAAMLIAARSLAKRLRASPGVVLVLTAAEETGCIASGHLARQPVLGRAGAVVVGEPTSNYPMVGHKGSIKFHAVFRGKSAHGSMPHLGVNAIYKASQAISRLEYFDFQAAPHPVMGEPTLNVGTIEGGAGVNLVPDRAQIGVDVRTVPGVEHAALLERLRLNLGRDAELEILSDLPPVWTQPDDAWVARVFEICRPHLGEAPVAKTAPYMTDAANLLKAWHGAPTVILGPGDAGQAHQTDESCSQERIRQSVEIYEAIIRDWCRL